MVQVNSPAGSANFNLTKLTINSIFDSLLIEDHDLYWDAPIVKNLFLILWVKTSLKHDLGNFITTQHLYEHYKIRLKNKPNAILPEANFYKDIHSALVASKILHTKDRRYGRRGITGIKFKN